MKRSPFSILVLSATLGASTVVAFAQAPSEPQVFTRPRTVSATPEPKPEAPASREQQKSPPAAAAASQPATGERQQQQQTPDAPRTNGTNAEPQPPAAPLPSEGAVIPLKPARTLSVGKFREKHTEAERLFKSRLQLTASSAPPSVYFVTLAAYEHDSSDIHLITIPKQTLLTRGAEVTVATSKGTFVRLLVVRPNYVNTAVIIYDMEGRQLTPLLIEYPIEKGGRFREMAYYTSAHPALLSPELVRNGKNYVRSMLDLAAKRLKDKGKIISPQLIDIAERLCIVEHVDHDRFRREDRKRLYEEVYSLFALNQLDTYRYSVSSAGAGGMVQMIPSTYAMVRRMHPSVGLNPDFVAGMRNHGNALEAMLLYMQDTWNDLALRQEVLDAMAGNFATQTELVAAGYNSNPARLPLYIRRGGPGWRNLIPRETQMYLQIYKSVESLVDFKDRAPSDDSDDRSALIR